MTAGITPITQHILREGDAEVTVLSMGCAVQRWQVGGRDMVLGYAEPESYRRNPAFMGCIVGRVANRLADGRFSYAGGVWDLARNDGANCLHGGPKGFGFCNWRLCASSDTAVRFSLHSPHLDQGFPGALDCVVEMSLQDGCLRWDMVVQTDLETPVNLAQHLYFNLGGQGDVLDHSLMLKGRQVTPSGPDLLPLGTAKDIGGTRYDFRNARRFRDVDGHADGYDVNYILDDGDGPQAVLTAPDGTVLALQTDQPCLQLYTASGLSNQAPASAGIAHQPFAGICLEAQGYPDAVNQPEFPVSIATLDTPYRQSTQISITRG